MNLKLILIFILLVNLFGSKNNYLLSEYNAANQVQIRPDQIQEISLENIFSHSKLQNAESLNNLNFTASGIVLLDKDSNTYLYKKNLNREFTIASITKLATSLAVLENFDLNEVVEVSFRAASIYGSRVHLNPGEKITVGELVIGMLVGSGNDAALALADHFGEDKLLILMNELAANLNLTNTHFADAAGLSLENRSTPRDLAILAKAALSHPFIAQAVKYQTYTMHSTDGSYEHLIHTTNRLLKNYLDITGVKTGYTDEAGFCLISGAEKNNHNFLLVLLGAESDNARFAESRIILDYAENHTIW